MRVGRAIQSGRGQAALRLYHPNGIYRRRLANNAPLAIDQTPALKLANQCNYGNANYNYTYNNPNYTYNGQAGPYFYGYEGQGMGYGGYTYPFQTTLDFLGAPYPFYIVDASVPTQTITFVNYTDPTTYTVRAAGSSNNLQSFFNAVPVPDVTKIPQGQIWCNGTDRTTTIWRPSTNELWEMWRLYGSPGSYVFGYGGYLNNVTTFNGIWPNNWGSSGSSLETNAGVVSIQDIIDVLRGGSINHALGFVASVTAANHVAPATRNDHQTVVPQYLADGTTINPAWSASSPDGNGYADEVAEGTWFRFPSTFNPASAMPGAGPIALAIATAIRDYGLYLHDGGGNCVIKTEDPRVLGSPYSYAKVNPFAGSTGSAAGMFDSYVNSNVPTSWTDASLPKISEAFHGTGNLMNQIPWQQLQVLEPFSS